MLGANQPRFEMLPPRQADKSPAPTLAQVQAVRSFVAQVGGMANAKAALDLLAVLRKP